MLLGNELLIVSGAETRAARVWAIRERTEHEAASLFDRLAADLDASGRPAALVALASRCAADERAHAVHCRAVVDALDASVAPLAPEREVRLGPASGSAARRALYASVALGCITESLSTALLIELRSHARLDVLRRALDVILEDEVRHSRLGWAHLAHEAEHGDVAWIAEHVPAMLRAALELERPREDAAPIDLARYGVLSAARVSAICRATIDGTIVPGFAHFGLVVG